MGAAVCTLLWSVSNNEEAVKNILGSVSLATLGILNNLITFGRLNHYQPC